MNTGQNFKINNTPRFQAVSQGGDPGNKIAPF